MSVSPIPAPSLSLPPSAAAPLILGGDLGGTKTLLALATPTAGGRFQIVREARFASGEFARFEELLAAFLPERVPVAAAAFGMAGPTDGLSGQMTWLPWRLSGAELAQAFGFGQVTLANDFAAAAHGLAHLGAHDTLTLQAGAPLAGAPRLILGAGTGLGVAGLVADPASGQYRVVPGEGGHMGFAPQSAQQAALWQSLFAQGGRVTSEDVLCGRGLARIHAFLGGGAREPADIGHAALAGNDARAAQSFALWSSIYGAFAGDLALHWLARGGVYLAGGIAARLLPTLGAHDFLAAFNAKREHRALAERMPVHLVTEERLGLLGALALAARSARADAT